jgi:hypothetical protein
LASIVICDDLSFYEKYQTPHCDRIFIWSHDVSLFVSDMPQSEIPRLIQKWNHVTNACICANSWHAKLFSERYPHLACKIRCVPNLVARPVPRSLPSRISGRFIAIIYESRELDAIVKLWASIVSRMPSARLVILSHLEGNTVTDTVTIEYIEHPTSEQIDEKIGQSEFWLYPIAWSKTTSMMAMKMMNEGVISVYYPLSGLKEDICGLPVVVGSEVETIIGMTENDKIRCRSDICNFMSKKYEKNEMFESWKKITKREVNVKST